MTITIAGTSHHAVTRRPVSTAVSARPTTTAAATVQSSPTMNRYQNRAKPTIHDPSRRTLRFPG
jgi:hypothetical protein